MKCKEVVIYLSELTGQLHCAHYLAQGYKFDGTAAQPIMLEYCSTKKERPALDLLNIVLFSFQVSKANGAIGYHIYSKVWSTTIRGANRAA